jgi:hypothetical protein
MHLIQSYMGHDTCALHSSIAKSDFIDDMTKLIISIIEILIITIGDYNMFIFLFCILFWELRMLFDQLPLASESKLIA